MAGKENQGTLTTMVEVERIRPREGNRPDGGMGDLEGLAESIRQRGLLQAIVIRGKTDAGPVMVNGSPGFEIVAGERRWRAVQLIGSAQIAANVVEADDREAAGIAAVENMQREDLDPLDEAFEVTRLLEAWRTDDRMPYDEVAARLGRTRRFVRDRASLTNLIPRVRKMLRDQASPLALPRALVLARLPAGMQEQILRDAAWLLSRTPQEMEARIAEQWLMVLSSAPFDREDPDLVPKAGKCSACPKRTGHDAELFPSLKKQDRCLDAKCFGAKLDANMERAKAAAKEEGLLLVSRDYSSHVPKDALRSGDWYMARAQDPGAKQALVVDGADRGKRLYVTLQRSTGGTGKLSEAEKARRNADREKKRVQRELVEATLEAALEKVIKLAPIKEGVDGPGIRWLRVIAREMLERMEWNLIPPVGMAMGWKPEKRQYGGMDWRVEGAKRIAEMGAKDLLLLMTRMAASAATGPYRNVSRLDELATALAVDRKGIEQAVREAAKARAKERAAKVAKKAPKGKKPRAGICRVCGCTQSHPCAGGCAWTDDTRTLCTACARKARKRKKAAKA